MVLAQDCISCGSDNHSNMVGVITWHVTGPQPGPSAVIGPWAVRILWDLCDNVYPVCVLVHGLSLWSGNIECEFFA